MRIVLLLVLWTGALFADVVTLNDGRQVSGVVESGNRQELRIKVGDQSQTIDIHQVQAIQFGVAAAPAAGKAAATDGRTLVLKNGTRVAGEWWSIDASQVHFLVDKQLQHYERSEVSAVTSGEAAVPPPAAPPVKPPAPSSPPPEPPAKPPATAKPPAAAKPQPAAPQPSSPSQPPAAPRSVSQPNEIGAVYFWNGKDLTVLEHNRAVERKRGATPYWEIPGARSSVRVEDASAHAFIVRLPKGVDPASYSLFLLTATDGTRQTTTDPSRQGAMRTWPFKIEINNESGYMTYAFIVRDLPTGEYSFSPSSSNDGYCFGVDAAQ